MDIRSQAEANCLMRYGTSLDLGCRAYWTDGNNCQSYETKIILNTKRALYLGNDIGHTGVWTHARDNTDVTWFSNVRTCSCDPEQTTEGGDVLVFYIGCRRIMDGSYCNGAYCDRYYSVYQSFICEGLI